MLLLKEKKLNIIKPTSILQEQESFRAQLV